MIEMTLSSRHRIQNSCPGGLRPSTLPLGHGGSTQYWLLHLDGEETFIVSFKPPSTGTEPRTLAWKAAVLTTTLGPPPSRRWNSSQNIIYFHRRRVLSEFSEITSDKYLDLSLVIILLHRWGTGMIASSSTFCPHLGRVIRDLSRLLDVVYGIVRKH